MASFEKAAKAGQRIHRERDQPSERRKFGHLEKHKDYLLRARNYQKKKEQLKKLQIQARDKNPDEFHFGMINDRVIGGKHVIAKDNNKQRPFKYRKAQVVEMRRIKTRELRAILLESADQKKTIEKLQCSLSLYENKTGFKKSNSHLRFYETTDEKKELMNSQDSTKDEIKLNAKNTKLSHYKKQLQARLNRLQELQKAERQLQSEILQMGQSAKKKMVKT
ncbi:putative U3 small nucleolar RNA-associated protein 11 [Trichoplax sp. H2]|uniref:U3 small nucleolar RNA-associated protein 11 n=1 Tax=Trichoplax adhaerens TaxID=10228 RepID=B3RYE8_TRIAD|nr:hypothetical protein TRIADDRAFT_56533 [Trichoplax adhaerens]EDV24586.1 hypothetical protein TRIADDRAFT_56533 [Trichoplax adhaerens]RDD45941.1 putative U3 small nucleolar RNA-associated protein 11 [Trichoplax sp. H2]|eukprot:XP_002112476.1 hypothetical protein TRIADDRAFT_56533 [Trichoplax adhaerens]